MASVQYGAVITDLKGSVGGHTFKGTKTGGSMQTKVMQSQGLKITKADAGRLINTKANLAQNARQWKGLTQVQRDTWITAAPSFPFLNRYGVPYTPSGFQLYMSCNNNILNIASPVISDAPAVEPIEPCPIFTMGKVAGLNLYITLATPIPAGYFLTLYSSAPQSEGLKMQRGRMKAIVILDSTAVSPVQVQTDYEAVFGTLPASGNIFCEGKITKGDAGRMGTPYTFQYTY